MADLSRMAVSASGDESLRSQLMQMAPLPQAVPGTQTAAAIAESQGGDGQKGQLSEKDKENFDSAIQNLNTVIKPLSLGLNIQRVAEIDRTYVQLYDRETGEVIREIPDHQIIEMQKNIRTMQGLFFDKFS